MSQQTNIKQQINTLKSLISDKKQHPIICNKVTLDWKQAQLSLSDQLTNQKMGMKLIDFQKQCYKNKISCFYSFFIMQKVIKDSLAQQILAQQTQNIQQQKSKYHQIKSFIKMRQHLLSKINQFTGSNIKSLFQDIDDIRFLNFQIIFLIDRWKNQWRVKSEIEPVFYQGNINYLLKINNDNVDMINLANFKKTKFISPPNPFFISEDGNLQGMSAKQKEDINICMEIINKERGIDLRMSVNGGIFVKKNQKGGKSKDKSQNFMKRQPSFKKEKKETSFVLEAKNQILSFKEEQIRKIYKINKSLQTTKTKANNQKIINVKIRKQSNQKKQIQKLKMYTNNTEKKYSSQKSIKQAATKEVNIIQAKLNINKNTKPQAQISKNTNSNIRSQIDKVVKELSQTESPIKKKEVKQMKPKIKLIEQKQSSVELPVKNVNISFNPSASRSLSRKNSTFYKKIQPIVEQTQDNQIAPPSQNTKKRSLSQSNFYPIKEKKQQIEKDNKSIDIKNIQSSVISKKKQAQSQIRNLNSQIKNLTIINIYKSKKNIKKPKNNSFDQAKLEESVAKNNAKSFITQIDNNQSKIDTSKLNLDLNRIKKQNENEISKISQQVSKKSLKIRKNQQILQTKQRKRLEAEKQLQIKSMIIAQLQQKIKNFQVKKTSHNNKKEQLLKNHTKQYQRTRKMRQIESKILKDKIKSQQQKFIANRQMELRLKQQSIKKQFKNNIKSLQMQTLKKKKQFQKIMIEQQKRFKETQKLIIKQKNRYKQIQNQLQQKRLKQALLKKIMEEKEEAMNKQYQSQKDLEKRLENQVKMREKMELQSLQLIQVEKKKMEQFYQQMIEKNKRIEQQNKLKLKQLNEIDQQRNRELQKLKDIQQNYQSLIKNQKNHQIIQPQQKNNAHESEDLQNLKLTLKQELLQEIIKKQEQEDREEKQQEERRQRRLKKIQEEIANALKAEEDQLQKENQQFLKKLQQIKQATIIPSTHQQQNQQQKFDQISQIEKNEQISQNEGMNTFQLKPADSIAEKDIDQQIKKIEELKQKNQQSLQISISKQEKVLQHKQEKIDLEKPNEQIKNSQVDPQITKQKPKESEKKQKIPQGQNLLQKYKKLKQFTKKTKQLTTQDKNISTFIDNFILQLQKSTRQMLPWNRYQLQKIFNTKKVDIYQYNTIGWMDQKERYNLIGGLQCIENIVKKYGTVQIHQLFIFDKTNPYQKQVLAKKMKLYQSIGFVYQKKLQESNKYSIRFVIKIPKEIGGQLKKSKPYLQSKITLQNFKETSNNRQYLNQCSVSYLFSRIIKQNVEKSKLQTYIQHPQHFNKTVQKQINQGILKNTYKHYKTEQINDNIISCQISLPFKYFRTQQRGFYLSKFSEYQLQDSHFYVSFIEQNLAIVLQQTKAKNMPLDFILFNTIQSINSSTKMRETDVCLPIWSYNNTIAIEQCGINLVYREKLVVEFSLGSVVSTFLLKHQYVEMRAPFIISYCQVGKQRKLIRPLTGHRVTEKEIIFNNLK